MPKVVIRKERCKGCELCIMVCPKNLLIKLEELNKSGFHPIGLKTSNDCSGCAFCAYICPEVAIELL
jgi:2-oxoglutarate ferredoxin oxidoreductase subunit delta